MTSFNYHFRPSVRKGRNKGSIFLRVIHQRRAFSLSMRLYVYAEEWEECSGSVIVPHSSSKRYPALRSVQDSLDSTVMQLERIISLLSRQGVYTVEDIRSELLKHSGSEMLSDFIDSVTAAIGGKQPRTARAYRSTYNSLMGFTGGKDVTLSGIDSRLVESYERYLEDKGLHKNTISFYMRNLRAVYNRAVKSNLIGQRRENPFSNVYTGITSTGKKALDAGQIKSLALLDPSIIDRGHTPREGLPSSLRDCLAMFLFCFLAQGMSFVDMVYLRKDSIAKGTLRYRRKKTGQYIEVAVCREMQSIIRYFAPRTKGSDYLFPVIDGTGKPDRLQYESALRLQNLRLKKLGILAGNIGAITTHAARHSWATIAKNELVDVSVISEALGHKSEKTTRIYLGSFKRKLLDKANERIRRAIKKAV
ncbi:MAG: site-specific integrase [Rikenellaceae bacterium]|nr:site-specific integrase [Rikenellaceae bacterium]